ncbi:MAG TPA: hypothetical protein VHY21_18615 [Pseudonocardiaceae bacterium]|jgi:acyl-CoA synthetase (AMP-forming)/AMP-acid ligase II|nr:hypothetical protein [Pseudonocardiaceae bacterium]
MTAAVRRSKFADMIRVGGISVDPAEVEAVMRQHPAVRSCQVVGVFDGELGQVVVHAVVDLTQPVDEEALLAHARQRLEPAQVPRSIDRTQQSNREVGATFPAMGGGVRVPGGMV